ncbi:hypothetical protein [Anaerobacillus alkaliphilus]|nr:hypothetical protein [Anaerobacillus alkaliphilus]
MVQRDSSQYKVTKGKIKDNGISAYEYTTGNKTSKPKQKESNHER